MDKAGKRSWREAAWRRRAAELLRREGLLRGKISIRRQACGKANCRCARGEKHEAMYVVYGEAGRIHQLYVPREWQARVRQWVSRYGEVRVLLEKLSGLYEGRVRRRRE